MTFPGVLLLFLYFLAVIAIIRLKRVHVSGRALFFFRAFFPSWRFFDEYGESTSLHYRVTYDGKNFESWSPCQEKQRRNLLSLIFNPGGNYHLACSSLLEHLVADLEEVDTNQPEKVSACVSYQLTYELVHRNVVKNLDLSHPPVRFQFKLSAPSEDILISPVYEV